MRDLQQLESFSNSVTQDMRIHATHISLYLALYFCYKENFYKSPFPITRCEVMKAAKISARSTYIKCLKQLHEYGYIRYLPSQHPLKSTMAHIPALHSPL